MWKRLLALLAVAITAVATMATPVAAVETTVDVYVDGVCVDGYALDASGNDVVTITVTPEGAATVEPYWLVIFDFDNFPAILTATLTLNVTPAPGYTLGFVGSWVDDGSDCGGDPGPEPDVEGPTVVWNTTITDGASYVAGSVPPAPTCSASDDGIGMVGACTVTGYSAEPGEHTLTVSVSDQLGNQTIETRRYTVLEPTDPPPGGDDITTVRIWGEDRYQTAVEASREAFPGGADTVFVASGTDFPDALAGGPAAAGEDGPILLVRPDRVPESVLAEIERLDPERIFLLGGASAVGDDVATTLNQAAPVQRLAGPDRYGTAAAVADRFWDSSGTVFLAVGTDFADALSGGSAAAKLDVPVLLTRSQALPQGTITALQALDPDRVVLLGGTAAISEAVGTAVGALLPESRVERVFGSDRYGTSLEVIQAFWPEGSREVYVATGLDFADALAGVPLAAANGSAPVLLTRPICAPAATLDALEHLDASLRVLLGGTSAIADEALDTACTR